MEYEDKNTYAATSFYAAPNEGTLDWRELVKGTPVYRAAGICSSGEVGFFSMLPSVRRKLVLVDHSYASLNVAMTKYLLLAKLGAKEVYRLFTVGEHQAIYDACMSVRDELPTGVKESQGRKRYDGDWLAVWSNKEIYNNRTGRYEYTGTPYNDSFEEIQNHWKKHISLDLVRQACKKLHIVKFLHGDLQDLAEEGPFGLVYLSNALEHNNRDQKHPTLSQVKACLKPDGFIIAAGRPRNDNLYGMRVATYNYTTHQYEYPKDKVVTEVKACDSTYSRQGGGTMSWKQAMYTLADEPVAA